MYRREKRKEIKLSARENLMGHYAAVIAALLITLLATYFLNIPFSNMISQGYYYGAPVRIVIGILGILIVALICFLLIEGVLWINLRLARKEEARFTNIIYPFTEHPGRFIGFELLFSVVTSMCLIPGFLCVFLSGTFRVREIDIDRPILFVIGCIVLVVGIILYIIIMPAWSMSLFLLLDQRDLRVMKAVRKSRQMMRGNRRRLIGLFLSFLGWLLFSILTLFIGLFWIVPYIIQSLTCFYLDLLPPEAAGSAPADHPGAGEEFA